MPQRVSVFPTESVAAWIDELPIEDALEVRRILGLIELDPSVDGINKITVPRPPAIFTCYVTPKFWIFYYLKGNDVAIVHVIERATGYIPVPW